MDSGFDRAEAENELDLIVDDFAYSLAETCKRLTKPEKDEMAFDGLVIFVDEADNATPDLHLGYFFKAVTELLQQHGCNNAMFVVAGLPDLCDKLALSHPSSIRIFSQLVITELSPDDRAYVVDRGLVVGNEINEQKTAIKGAARTLISRLSEGYPHFIQQFAYSVFEFNQDGEIDEEDVAKGAFSAGGALDLDIMKVPITNRLSPMNTDRYWK